MPEILTPCGFPDFLETCLEGCSDQIQIYLIPIPLFC